MTGDECKDCRAHSGIEARMESMERRQTSQEKEMEGLKRLMLTTLVGVVMVLLGVIANLAYNISQIPK